MATPMQVRGPYDVMGLPVASDLSAKQFHVVKLSSGNIICSSVKAEAVIGVLIDEVDGSSDTKTGTVQFRGIARIKTGGAISEMDQVIANDDGTILTDDAANQFIVGIALKAGDSGDIIPVLLVLAETTTA